VKTLALENQEKRYILPKNIKSRKFLLTLLFVVIFLVDNWWFKQLAPADLAVLAGVLGFYNVSEGLVDASRYKK
jgi:hypothetical protein